MKKIIGLMVTLTLLASGINAFAATFGAGNIVVVRFGDGSQSVTNAGQTIFLDEYTTNSIWLAAGTFGSPTPIQSIQMPTNWYGANAPLIADGTGAADGQLSRSQDGRYLVLTGYGATLSSGASQTYQITNGALSSTTVTGLFNQVSRVVGLVDGFGHIFTTTTQTNGNEEGDDPRSATTVQGTNIWMGGSSKGTKYLTRGSLVSTQVCETLSINRAMNVYSNVLYIDDSHDFLSPTNTSAGVNVFPGSSLPTNSVPGNFVQLPSVYGTTGGSAFGFAMFNVNGGSTIDTIYVADSATNCPGEPFRMGGGVLKFCYVSGNWTYVGRVCAAGATWVTGTQNGTNISLYITEGGNTNAVNILYPYNDISGFAHDPQSNPDGGDANQYSEPIGPPSLNASLFNTRGIAVTPQGGETGSLSGPGIISVGPPYSPYFSGPAGGPFTPSNYTYSVANLGTTATNWFLNLSAFTGGGNWLTASATSGSLAPGASTTVTFTPNATANTLLGGSTYTGKILIHDGGVAAPTIDTLSAQMVVYAFFITPSSNYIAVGEPGGPFAPSNYVYAISNATSGALNWSANTSNNWSTVSPAGGSLPGLAVTNVTVSINNNANPLGIGSYQDVVTFSNVSAAAQLTTRSITLQVGFGIFDDFSTYANGNVVGQNNWLGSAVDTDNPVQITNGVFTVPGGCPGSTSQQPYKYVAASQVTNPASYAIYGMSVTFTNGSPDPNYTFVIETTFLGLANSGIEDIGGGQYVWTTELNSYQTTPTIGTVPYSYYTNYLVFIVADGVNSNAWVFVNPGTNDFGTLMSETPAVWSTGGNCSYCPGESPGFNSITAGQYSSCPNSLQQGYMISKLAASTNYADVYNFLVRATNTPPPTDPFTTWQDHYFTTELGTPSFSGPNADPFGKGMSNTNQFLAGFNPTNAAAYLHITAISKTNSGTDVRVDYLGASGDSTYSGGPASRTNVLEFTAGSSGSYNSNGFASTGVTNILSGGTGLGTLANMVDPGGATNKPTRYYRVRVLVP